MKSYYLITPFLVCSLLFSCQSGNDKKYLFQEVSKTTEKDPFRNTMIESQYFEVDSKQDNVVEGKNGTVLFIPKGGFLDKNGNPVQGKVTVELAEPNSLSDIILSNLTTTSKGTPLNSAGMLYVSAKADGEQIMINPDNPLYAEVATDANRENMEVYYGERDEKGKMDWTDPEPLEKWLVPVDLSLLNFYPPGFEEQVEMEMPFRNYTVATKELKDSLYYSLTTMLKGSGRAPAEMEMDSDSSVEFVHHGEGRCNVINPASIKVLKEKRFENTLIETREFEKRLQVIFGTCNQEVLDLYIQQSDKNLWEIDAMAAELLGESNTLYTSFRKFSDEKLAKVQNSPAANAMSSYYAKQVKKVEEELLKTRKEYEQYLKTKDKQAEKKKEEYKELLVKRQIYRLEKFGYKVKRNGYYNICEILKDLETFELTVHVKGSDIKKEREEAFDRVHVYIVNPLIKSLFAMVSDNDSIFDRGYEQDQFLLMWKEQKAVALVVAYKDEQPYYAQMDFNVMKVNNLFLKPIPVSMIKLKETLDEFKKYSKENKIVVDLEYQEFFFKEMKRKKQLLKEEIFIRNLYYTIIGSCCDVSAIKGKELFIRHCKACHCKDEVKVGPALKDISKRRSNGWISGFIRNSQNMIKAGDPYAVNLYIQYNKTEMTAFPTLSDGEILGIIAYLNSLEKDNCSREE